MNKENINEKDSKLFDLYTLAEMSYEKHFKEQYDVESLYPIDWYQNKNYKEKIEIIAQAIKMNILIINTPRYQNLIEGVVKKYIKEN